MPSANEWRAHIARCEEIGRGPHEYCSEHGLNASTMSWWRSELRRRDQEGRDGHKPKGAKKKAPSSKPVKLAKVIRRTASSEEARSPVSNGVRLAIAGAEVFVEPKCDRQLLADVIALLRGATR